MIFKDQISEKLSSYSILQKAKEKKFTMRSGGKIDALNFIQSFFIMIQTGGNTLKRWAETLSLSIDSQTTISDVAVHHKLQFRQVAFFTSLLSDVIADQITNRTHKGLTTNLLESFGRVFLEDSTCINLPKNVADFFKGSHSSAGKAATARIQFRTELKQGTASHIELQSFRDNDQSFSAAILQCLLPKDLVIRDMGYFSLKVFKQIIAIGAYVLTRYLPNTHLFETNEQQDRISLINLIRKAKNEGKTVIEQSVIVGAKDLVPFNLIMVKVPEKIAAQRRRKAKKNRNRRINYSKEYMELLDWSIFLTNVDKSVWSPADVLKVYGYRWRIENIFKCWKTHFNFQSLFADKQSLTPARVIITIYLLLIWIVLFFNRLYIYFEKAIFEKKNEFISLMKFADFIIRWFTELGNSTELENYIDRVYYYCKYNKRKGRENFAQTLYYKKLA